MSNPKLALIPSGYNDSIVYSVLPSNGSGDFQFDRSGSGTRVNKDGLIETITEDYPRLDWLNSNCPILLLEGQKTNELYYSSDFNNWSKTNITVASDSQTSPSGEYDADPITRNSALTSYISKQYSKSSSANLDMTLSVFVRQNVGDYFALRAQGTYPNRVDVLFQFSTKTFTTSEGGVDFQLISTNYDDYGNGWYRLSFKYETDSASTCTVLFSPRTIAGQVDSTDGASDSSVFLWGAQCEYNDLSSFIPTTTGSGTREAETCTGSTDATIFNDSEGVLYAEVSTNFEGIGGVKAVSVQYDANNYVAIYFRNDNNLSARVVGSGNITQVDTTYAINTFYKIAVSYNSTNVKFYVNGTQVDIDTTNTLPTSLNKISFNRGSGYGTEMEGKCKDLRYYDTALTDAELTALTT